jgi:hypothetical protein
MDPITGGLIGGGMQAVGGMVEGKKNRQMQRDFAAQQRKDIGIAQGRLDDYLSGVTPQLQGIASAAMDPQVTTQTSSGTSSMDSYTAPEVTAQFKPTLNMLQNAYQGRVAEADFLPEGLLEGEYQQIAAEEERGMRDIENVARSRGVDPSVLRIGSPVQRNAAASRSAARRGAEEMKYQRKGSALADLGNLAQIWGRAQRGRQRGRTSGTSTTTGPANYNAALGAIGAQRPDIILPT